MTRRHLQRRNSVSAAGRRQESENVSESQLCSKVFVFDQKRGEWMGQHAVRSGGLDAFLVDVFFQVNKWEKYYTKH